MTEDAPPRPGRGAAGLAALAGVASLPVALLGSTSFVVGLLLGVLALGLAAYSLLEQDGLLTDLLALVGVVAALAGPVLLVLGFMLQE